MPRSFVCVDISHNQGRDTVGSLVWFEAGRPRKSEYRKFKIKGLGQQDDFAAIQEVAHPLPDPPAGRAAAAPRPHRDRRWQGPAERRARGGRAARPAGAPDREPRQAGRGGLPARPRPRASGSPGGAPRSGCSSGHGTRPTGSGWPTTGSGGPSGRSRPSCSAFPGSAPPSAAGCWSDSAAWPGVKSASVTELAAVPGLLSPPGGTDPRASEGDSGR